MNLEFELSHEVKARLAGDPSLRARKTVHERISVEILDVPASDAPIGVRYRDEMNHVVEMRLHRGQWLRQSDIEPGRTWENDAFDALWNRTSQMDAMLDADLIAACARAASDPEYRPDAAVIVNDRERRLALVRELAAKSAAIDGAIWTATGEPTWTISADPSNHRHGPLRLIAWVSSFNLDDPSLSLAGRLPLDRKDMLDATIESIRASSEQHWTETLHEIEYLSPTSGFTGARDLSSALIASVKLDRSKATPIAQAWDALGEALSEADVILIEKALAGLERLHTRSPERKGNMIALTHAVMASIGAIPEPAAPAP